jgi:hypothetical protein
VDLRTGLEAGAKRKIPYPDEDGTLIVQLMV